MATTYTSKKLAFSSAEQFKESFSEPNPTVGYLFIGNHLPYENEDSPSSIIDNVADEKTIWDNMYAARRVTGFDVELVIPRYTWAANSVYRHYDDKVDLDSLVSANANVSVSGIGFYEDEDFYGNKPMYVMNSERNVYICLDNAENANSTVEPSGKNLSSNGNIQTAKGIFALRLKGFLESHEWIPAKLKRCAKKYSTTLQKILALKRKTVKLRSACQFWHLRPFHTWKNSSAAKEAGKYI